MKFVNKQLALKLKEKGFDRPCFNAYNAHGCQYLNGWCEYLDERDTDFIYLSDLHDKDCLCPTIEQVLEWSREKDIMVFPIYSKNTSRWYCEIVNADSLESYKLPLSDSYEDACIAGIEYVINNLI